MWALFAAWHTQQYIVPALLLVRGLLLRCCTVYNSAHIMVFSAEPRP